MHAALGDDFTRLVLPDPVSGIFADQEATGQYCGKQAALRAGTDASAARGVEVRHLMHGGRTEPHRPSDGLRLRDDGLLVYDSGQPTLL